MLKKTLSKAAKEDGISLIEVAIALIVLGLIVAPIMQNYNIRIKKESRAITVGSLLNVQKSINQYYFGGSGAYPCPASLTIGEGDPNFGDSGDCTLANVKLCTNITWQTTEGICKTDDTSNAVIIGGVPFAKLKMQQDTALDYWGNKIIYAVTFEQTDGATFASNNGQIRAYAVDSPTLIANGLADGVPEIKPQEIDFFLFSTGETAIGGFTKDGIIISTCGNASNGWESENCDFDSIFFHDADPSMGDASAFSEVVGVNFYDDLTLGQVSVPETTWFQHPDNVSYADDFVVTLNTDIGIDTSTPSETIDVNGDVRVEGWVKTDSICDNNNANCFDPELITGTKDEMECDTGSVISGRSAVIRLAENRVFCSTAKDDSGNPIGDGQLITIDTNVINDNTCNDGYLISGIDANGDIQCVLP